MQSDQDFDFVIVGGGSAGCVLANRLSAKGDRVLLLEAGGEAKPIPYDLPFLAAKLFERKVHNWNFRSEPQCHMNGTEIDFPRGKMLGGSFIFNGAQYVRGASYDYDHWRQMGNVGWSYEDVLPYFLKSEKYEGSPGPYHSRDGLLPVSKPPIRNPLSDAFLQACEEAGLPRNDDFNGAQQEGFGIYDFNFAHGRRQTTARTFLNPVRNRTNLRVEVNAEVSRILFDGRRVVGVEYAKGGLKSVARARREVILAAGSFNSPKLLLLSGVGKPPALAEHGITSIADLPGVGENLQEHVNVSVANECTQPVSLARMTRLHTISWAMLQGIVFKRGQVVQSPLEAGGFFSTRPDAPAPEFQCVFVPFFPNGPIRMQMPWAPKLEGHSYYIVAWLNRPKSRGRLWLRSANPKDPPRFDPNFFSDPDDLIHTRDGIRMARSILAQDAFRPYRGAEIAPGIRVQDDKSLDDYISATAGIGYHTCGTAKMGNDPMAVVDDRLRVHGIGGLRVADASIMPTITSGNTNAPTIMIAEKAADMILADRSMT
jgi:choline dehydrogenase